MNILLCIDGTGVASDSQYAREMAHSHVRKIWWHSTAAPSMKHYMRGPTVLGSEMLDIVSRGYNYVFDRVRQIERDSPPRVIELTDLRPRVLLTGYSRGAAAIVCVAQRLAAAGISVAAMALFDCVDRAIILDSTRVPPNVEWLIHAMRDDAAGSRESFNHSGTVVSGRTRQPPLSPRRFFGTHGAIGGVPWTGGAGDEYIDEGGVDGATRVTFARDRQCSDEVWRWMRPYLRQQGFLA